MSSFDNCVEIIRAVFYLEPLITISIYRYNYTGLPSDSFFNRKQRVEFITCSTLGVDIILLSVCNFTKYELIFFISNFLLIVDGLCFFPKDDE